MQQEFVKLSSLGGLKCNVDSEYAQRQYIRHPFERGGGVKHRNGCMATLHCITGATINVNKPVATVCVSTQLTTVVLCASTHVHGVVCYC